jgi:hypothetical protein
MSSFLAVPSDRRYMLPCEIMAPCIYANVAEMKYLILEEVSAKLLEFLESPSITRNDDLSEVKV